VELALDLLPGAELGRAERILTHRRLELRAYRCRVEPGTRAPRGASWIATGALADAPLPAAMRALLGPVRDALAPTPPSGGERPRRKIDADLPFFSRKRGGPV
jgi:hypothetical protein